MPTETALVQALTAELSPLGFEARPAEPACEGVEIAAALVRKTWNTNRAVVVLHLPAGAEPGPLSERIKLPLGKMLGYFPFFYGIGMQLVWLGYELGTPKGSLDAFVDRIDNQRAIVQSLFVVDLATGAVSSARTWGQVITGRFQDAIERVLRAGPDKAP